MIVSLSSLGASQPHQPGVRFGRCQASRNVIVAGSRLQESRSAGKSAPTGPRSVGSSFSVPSREKASAEEQRRIPPAPLGPSAPVGRLRALGGEHGKRQAAHIVGRLWECRSCSLTRPSRPSSARCSLRRAPIGLGAGRLRLLSAGRRRAVVRDSQSTQAMPFHLRRHACRGCGPDSAGSPPGSVPESSGSCVRNEGREGLQLHLHRQIGIEEAHLLPADTGR